MTKLDVLTGFLGAGKTTFANYLLAFYIRKGLKTVFIVNEFGDTSIDSQIISHQGFSSRKISGGCVCCTLKTETALALEEIIDAYNPDRIVFETSGIFVFNNFFEILKSDTLKNKCETGNSITVVDGLNFKKSKIRSGSFIDNQLKNSNIAVISKTDGENTEIAELLYSLNDNIVILSKPFDKLTDSDMQIFLDGKAAAESDRIIAHTVFESVTVTPKEFTSAQFQTLLDNIRTGILGRIIRAKGTLKIGGALMHTDIVYASADTRPCAFTAEEKLTFIGEKLSEKFIKERYSK